MEIWSRRIAASPSSRKGIVMSTRLRRIVLSIVALTALAVVPWAGTGGVSAMADPVCSNGTNWDNILQVCR
jgi:hypothetical protein